MSPDREGAPKQDALRRRAEARLSAQETAGGQKRAAASAVRLVHELQVHQIELEMMNEELEQARCRAETLLAEFTDVYDYAPVGYLTFDRDGTCLRSNLTGARLIGVERSRLVNRRFALLVAEGDRPAFADFLARVFASREKTTCDVTLGREGVAGICVRIEGVVANDGYECRAVLLDLTERRAAEARLRESEERTHRLLDVSERSRLALLSASEDQVAALGALRASELRYRQMFDASPNPMSLVDRRSLRFLDVNAALVKQLGWSREELLRMTPMDTQAPEERHTVIERVRSLLAAGASDAGVHRHRRKDGSVVLMETRVSAFEFAGRPALLCVSADVTERTRTQERILTLSRALEHSPVSLVITDTAGNIEYVNPHFTKASGYGAAEVLGKNPRILKSGKHSQEFYAGIWAELVAGRVWRGEIENRRKDGTIYPETVSISPVKDADGRTTHYVAVKEDLTSRRLLEEEFRQAQKMEAVGRLAGGVAHDFNNMLTIISGYTEMVTDSMEPADPRRVSLGQVQQAAHRAQELTHRLLAFSRRQTLNPSLVDLNDVVHGVTTMLSQFIGEDVVVRTDLAAEPTHSIADRAQVEQALLNLCINARDAMALGGTLTIATSNFTIDEAFVRAHKGTRVGLYACLCVTDTGTGMSADVRSRIFEPFFTTKPEGKGTGLGLAMVYGFVSQSEGYVDCESVLGRGSTFRILLPAVGGDAGPPVEIHRPPPSRGSETVLVVDDQPEVAQVARIALEQRGYAVLCAIGGEAALQACEAHGGEIHLLLTDVVMPGLNGRQLATKLQERWPAMRVLFMSGYSDDTIAAHGILDPGTELLQKPFRPLDLCAKVRAVLDAAPPPVPGDEPGLSGRATVRPG